MTENDRNTSEPSGDTHLVAMPFHGDEIVTFQAKGEPHVAMRRIVENLGMGWGSQSQKLAAQRVKFDCSDIVTVDASGRQIGMLAMPVRKLPLWLATINPNKVSGAVRPKLELYQTESAVALHDYWTKGAAIRGDFEGVVTDLDPAARKVFGGIMRGVVHREIAEALQVLLPTMIREAVGSTQFGVVQGMTAGDVLDAAGITERKGLRGLARRVSDRLRLFHAERKKAVELGRLGSNRAYMFDPLVSREWLDEGGRASIQAWIAEKRGQGVLKLVPKA